MSGRKTLTDIFTVMREPKLTPVEKVVWTILRSYDSGKGAWPSDYLMSGHIDMSDRTVQRARRRLILLGYLTQDLRGQRPSIYRAIVPGGEPYTPPPMDELTQILGRRSAKPGGSRSDK